MAKRTVLTLVFSLFLGVLTSGVVLGSAPSVLRVTGPVLCEAGTRFVEQEGATIELPENRRVAPVHFACVAADGTEREPNMGAAALLVFLGITTAWGLVVAWGVRRLEIAAKGSRSS